MLKIGAILSLEKTKSNFANSEHVIDLLIVYANIIGGCKSLSFWLNEQTQEVKDKLSKIYGSQSKLGSDEVAQSYVMSSIVSVINKEYKTVLEDIKDFVKDITGQSFDKDDKDSFMTWVNFSIKRYLEIAEKFEDESKLSSLITKIANGTASDEDIANIIDLVVDNYDSSPVYGVYLADFVLLKHIYNIRTDIEENIYNQIVETEKSVRAATVDKDDSEGNIMKELGSIFDAKQKVKEAESSFHGDFGEALKKKTGGLLGSLFGLVKNKDDKKYQNIVQALTGQSNVNYSDLSAQEKRQVRLIDQIKIEPIELVRKSIDTTTKSIVEANMLDKKKDLDISSLVSRSISKIEQESQIIKNISDSLIESNARMTESLKTISESLISSLNEVKNSLSAMTQKFNETLESIGDSVADSVQGAACSCDDNVIDDLGGGRRRRRRRGKRRGGRRRGGKKGKGGKRGQGRSGAKGGKRSGVGGTSGGSKSGTGGSGTKGGKYQEVPSGGDDKYRPGGARDDKTGKRPTDSGQSGKTGQVGQKPNEIKGYSQAPQPGDKKSIGSSQKTTPKSITTTSSQGTSGSVQAKPSHTSPQVKPRGGGIRRVGGTMMAVGGAALTAGAVGSTLLSSSSEGESSVQNVASTAIDAYDVVSNVRDSMGKTTPKTTQQAPKPSTPPKSPQQTTAGSGKATPAKPTSDLPKPSEAPKPTAPKPAGGATQVPTTQATQAGGGGVIDKLKSVASEVWDKIKNLFSNGVEYLEKNGPSWSKKFIAVIKKIGEGVTTGFSKLWSMIGGGGISKILSRVTMPALLKFSAKASLRLLKMSAVTILGAGGTVLSGGTAGAVLVPVMTILDVYDAGRLALDLLELLGIEEAAQVNRFLDQMWDNILSEGWNIIKGGFNYIKEKVAAGAEWAKEALNKAGQFIVEKAEKVKEYVQEKASQAKQFVEQKAQAGWAWFANTRVGRFLTGIVDRIQQSETYQTVKEAVSTVYQSGKNLVKSGIEQTGQFLGSGVKAVASGFQKGFEWVGSGLKKGTQLVKSGLGSLFGGIREAVQENPGIAAGAAAATANLIFRTRLGQTQSLNQAVSPSQVQINQKPSITRININLSQSSSSILDPNLPQSKSDLQTQLLQQQNELNKRRSVLGRVSGQIVKGLGHIGGGFSAAGKVVGNLFNNFSDTWLGKAFNGAMGALGTAVKAAGNFLGENIPTIINTAVSVGKTLFTLYTYYKAAKPSYGLAASAATDKKDIYEKEMNELARKAFGQVNIFEAAKQRESAVRIAKISGEGGRANLGLLAQGMQANLIKQQATTGETTVMNVTAQSGMQYIQELEKRRLEDYKLTAKKQEDIEAISKDNTELHNQVLNMQKEMLDMINQLNENMVFMRSSVATENVAQDEAQRAASMSSMRFSLFRKPRLNKA